MGKIVDQGPRVVHIPENAYQLRMTLLRCHQQTLHALRSESEEAKAEGVALVSRNYASVIALCPTASWMGHMVTVLKSLDQAAGKSNLDFERGLDSLAKVVQQRVDSAVWSPSGRR